MGQLLLLTIGALVVGAIGFGIAVLISGADPGLQPVEPDGRAVGLPVNRPLVESDLGAARFDTAVRGYRMGQVDTALRRAAYDIGYKQELIGVLEAEVDALREGRVEEADKLRSARRAALSAIADGPQQRTEAPAHSDETRSSEGTAEAAEKENTDEADKPEDDVLESHEGANTDAADTDDAEIDDADIDDADIDGAADSRQREMRLP
jgi:DivIVA domain-containing protein